MKKIFTLMAAVTVVLAANAGTRVLYSQDFETVASPAEAGWTYGGASMEIASDDFGKFLQLYQGTTNGRNAQLSWGTDIYGENASILEDGKYTVEFDFSPKVTSNNQYNSAITVLSNLTPPANQPYIYRWSYLKDEAGENITDPQAYVGYLFDISQQQVTHKDENNQTVVDLDVKDANWFVNGDTNDVITLEDNWYTITLEIDVNSRVVDYTISSLLGDVVTSGSRTVPATECDGTEISMYATGLWVMVARYQTTYLFDNIKVYCESSADVANVPTVALTRIGKDADGNLDLAHRAYTITFIEGEILHVLGTNGVEEVISYFDCDGAYEYTTTTSGTLVAWTTSGNAESEHVITEVDCSPIVLPVAEASVISVVNGYGKTYKLTVDNSKVELAPQIFITYKFVGDEGEIVEGDEQSSGVTFNVSQSGTLTITTKAYGYKENSVTLKNDVKYTERYVVDFARMTTDQIVEAGFTKDEDLNSGTTSGEQNWTARKRIYYYDAASAHADEETGETVYDPVYPIGFISEDDTEHVLHRYIISADDMTAEKAASLLPNFVCWNGLQAKMLEHIGLIQDATTNNYNAVTFTNCGPNDIVVINTTNSYGSNSVHPLCNNDDEFWAVFGGEDAAFPISTTSRTALGKKEWGAWVIPVDAEGNAIEDEAATTPASYNISFNLFRIDTALCKATVFQGGESGIQDVSVDAVKNLDNGWYTIDGIRLDTPTHSGLYIHQGKKVYIRK